MTAFAAEIEKWYAEHGRELPWRDIADPYRIWISEIILQQTRVVQGYDYYLRFIEAFPTVFRLAAASEDEVMKMWQGLGYYSRARNLHAAAKSVAEQGRFPETYEGVRALKGVGDYTAAAICSFAYGLPHAVVDGNVYRVLSRVFGVETPIDTTAGKKEFAALARELLDEQRPGLYNQALMDFGALQCVPASPDCGRCPLGGMCRAFAERRVAELPVKSKRTAVKDRYLVYIYMCTPSQVFLHRRAAGDIWQGLHEPYLLEFAEPATADEIFRQVEKCVPMAGAKIEMVAKDVKHVLTHRRLHVDCYVLSLPEGIAPPEGYFAVPAEERDGYAVPALVSRLYEKIKSYLCETKFLL